MIVSWNWLKQYVSLDMSVAELEHRLMMAGWNHEGTEDIAGDFAIDLEVTSNRPDCLGHIGVAREVAVLYEQEMTLPAAAPTESNTPVSEFASVSVECPELCRRYTARVIRGVKVGPSPSWIRGRLETLGVATINNIVDITNYVLFECSQPLHAFDLAKIAGGEIIVREARRGEQFEAINHKTYELAAGVCVIADAERAVALGGVMGGAETEVSEATVDLLIEAADFAPRSIRDTARLLNLHSDSSHRFERGIDPEGVDWASRRCCELILELAGGELAGGVIDVATPRQPNAPVALRYSQLKRILGIDIDTDEVRRIFAALGTEEQSADSERVEVVPPSWRRDLTREIDLVEEAGRIHGYEAIPEDVQVPMVRSVKRHLDRVMERVRHVLTASGFDEAMTTSVVTAEMAETFSPWSDAAPLRCMTPILRGADCLRRSLVPSLLVVQHTNQTLANRNVDLFESAHVYLPPSAGADDATLPNEEMMLAVTAQRDLLALKGVVEMIVADLSPSAHLEVRPADHELFQSGRFAELWLNDTRLGVIGELSPEGLKRFDLREATTVAELQVSHLEGIAQLERRYEPVSVYPAIDRDINLVFDESVSWADVAKLVRTTAGGLLERLEYRGTYRDEKIGVGKKSILVFVSLRDPKATLTNAEADAVRSQIVSACGDRLGGVLRA